jgi:hypothetical protein
MPTRKKNSPEPEVTAQPRSPAEGRKGHLVEESGLSVAPEDLGRQFLSDATEQGNYESSQGGETSELALGEGAPSDDAMSGSAPEAGQSIWESTVSLSMQSGDQLRDESLAGDSADTQESAEGEEEVDLTDENIREASLLDREADTLGETEEPSPRTDDTRKRAARPAARPSRTL